MKKYILLPLLTLTFIGLTSFTTKVETEELINNSEIQTVEDFDCFDDAIRVGDVALDGGFSDIAASCVGNVAFARCQGYDIEYATCSPYLNGLFATGN